jgi:hypothetical protein
LFLKYLIFANFSKIDYQGNVLLPWKGLGRALEGTRASEGL